MISKSGFTRMTIDEFGAWIRSQRVARTVLTIQQHHTFSPSYALFKGSNHFELQQNMKNHHINYNGWNDIGQHFTTFPDGTIMTGRSLEKSPACITGQNANSICIEHLGNFDHGKDVLSPVHRATIVQMTTILCSRYNLPVNTNSIVYHHWFDLSTGQRNNGTKNNKSCPGTNFFGGNKVSNCLTNFLPLVIQNLTSSSPASTKPVQYVCVTASTLNIRTGPDSFSAKVKSREAATLGAILRVYDENNGWYKISDSQAHWVASKFTVPVSRATVISDVLNVRNGPGKSFEKLGGYFKDQELFIIKESNGWCKVSMDEKWVSKEYLAFT